MIDDASESSWWYSVIVSGLPDNSSSLSKASSRLVGSDSLHMLSSEQMLNCSTLPCARSLYVRIKCPHVCWFRSAFTFFNFLRQLANQLHICKFIWILICYLTGKIRGLGVFCIHLNWGHIIPRAVHSRKRAPCCRYLGTLFTRSLIHLRNSCF